MMRQTGSVAFVIPCLNEEATIARVVADCRAAIPAARVCVFDNNSTDQTAAVASRAGAEVISCPKPGKGEVIAQAFAELREDVLVILDGDGTYDASLAPTMAQLILKGRCEMVVCTRVSAAREAYPRLHVSGNRVFSALVSVLLSSAVSDVFSGYRAVSRSFYENILLEASGFEVESELTLKAVSRGFTVREISGSYASRPEGSHSKLRTFHDGWKILKFIFLVLRDCRPLLFFNSLALGCVVLSILSGIAPILDYIEEGYVHTVPRAILAASLMVLSSVLFGVGLILDSHLRHLREQSKLMRRWLQRQEQIQPVRARSASGE